MRTQLTADECSLVQASFAQVDPMADRVAAMFYGRLFELNPALAPLFKIDMAVQSARFMEKLAIAVKGLDDLDGIAPFVQVLGRRHVDYGVKTNDYDTVCDALLWALEAHLGSAFGPDARAAWRAAYEVLATMMIEAGKAQAS
ncbi:MAG TPA: globin family protein [Candidatus Baltobacteraceae bacterium]|nr:globin family protein [Candidatus Baltobacteraceae bacterium]